MKSLLCSLLLTACAVGVIHADIQAPPVSNQGPTRKLSRGFANTVFAITDWQQSISEANDYEGNASAFSFGFIRGAGRFLTRTGYGLYEMATFPFPLTKGKYTPALRNDVPWIHSGYSEFPPELGFESRYNYTRSGVN